MSIPALQTSDGPKGRHVHKNGLILAFLITFLLLWQVWDKGNDRLLAATVVGLFAGFSLYHASFGFTSAWRRFHSEARGAGLRWQILLILLVALVSYPLISPDGLWGVKAGGFVFPFGVAAALGAFVFGIGMQFGGGCASGTLFTAGGGSVRMMITLVFFVAGSLLATAHSEIWGNWPRLPAVSLVREFGAAGAYGILLALLGGVFLFSRWWEKRRHGGLEQDSTTPTLVRGPWPKGWGVVALAVVSLATLLILSRPWGITSGFALWGAKIAAGLGVEVQNWAYWKGQRGALENSLFAHSTSVMNFGIMAGALFAASLAGKFAPTLRIAPREILTAVLGGLLMGYGARLAYGCNIGAYLGGLVSGSLHGWGWLLFGFLGSVTGDRLKRGLLQA